MPKLDSRPFTTLIEPSDILWVDKGDGIGGYVDSRIILGSDFLAQMSGLGSNYYNSDLIATADRSHNQGDKNLTVVKAKTMRYSASASPDDSDAHYIWKGIGDAPIFDFQNSGSQSILRGNSERQASINSSSWIIGADLELNSNSDSALNKVFNIRDLAKTTDLMTVFGDGNTKFIGNVGIGAPPISTARLYISGSDYYGVNIAGTNTVGMSAQVGVNNGTGYTAKIYNGYNGGTGYDFYANGASTTTRQGFSAHDFGTNSANNIGFLANVVNIGAGKAYSFYALNGDIFTAQSVQRHLYGAGTHVTKLGGNLSNDKLQFQSNAGTAIAEFKGDGTSLFYGNPQIGETNGVIGKAIVMDGNGAATTLSLNFKSNGFTNYIQSVGNQLFINATGNFYLRSAGVNVVKMNSNSLILEDGKNLAVGTVTGSKIGEATTSKLGFWGKTPVVQQILATGSGATADDIITFLQNIGLCKQS